MSYEQPRIISVSGRTIKIAHLDLPSQPLTYLASDLAINGTALTVLDNSGFANTNLILFGELGNEKTEIKNINGVVTTGTSITSTAVTFEHSAGTEVRKLIFNQYKIYGTTTNVYITDNLISTVDIQVDAPHTSYVNVGTEYAYYWVVPYDSVNAVTGDNSDSVAKSTGYASNEVGSIIASALGSTKKTKGGTITEEWLIKEINDCSEYIASKLKRWSHLQNFDYVLGYTSMGRNSWTLPSDIQDKNSNKSILGVRIGGEVNLEYKDKRDWETMLKDVLKTEVTTQAVATDVTLEIDNSYDFADSGSVNVYISGTEYTITYTGVTRSATAGILTGIPVTGDGSITVTIPAGTNVWVEQEDGKPEYYTVYDGSLYIWALPNSTYENMNVILDYFTSRTMVDSSSDMVEPTRYLLYTHWLRWKLKGLDNASGKLDATDLDFVLFQDMLKDMVSKEVSGQRYKMKPRVNKITY